MEVYPFLILSSHVILFVFIVNCNFTFDFSNLLPKNEVKLLFLLPKKYNVCFCFLLFFSYLHSSLSCLIVI